MPKPKKWKRGRPKQSRAGCLLCKPHKHNGVDVPKRQEARARIEEREEFDALGEEAA